MDKSKAFYKLNGIDSKAKRYYDVSSSLLKTKIDHLLILIKFFKISECKPGTVKNTETVIIVRIQEASDTRFENFIFPSRYAAMLMESLRNNSNVDVSIGAHDRRYLKPKSCRILNQTRLEALLPSQNSEPLFFEIDLLIEKQRKEIQISPTIAKDGWVKSITEFNSWLLIKSP